MNHLSNLEGRGAWLGMAGDMGDMRRDGTGKKGRGRDLFFFFSLSLSSLELSDAKVYKP